MPNVDSVERNQLSAQAANVWNNVLYVASHKKDISYNPFNVRVNPADIYLLNVNNRNARTRCEICSKLTKAPEWGLASFWYLYC